MPARTNNLQSPPHPAVLSLLIVARDQPELYRTFQRRFQGCAGVAIFLDRRHGERRQATQPVAVDRRRGERRSALYPRNDLRQRKYIFARPEARCPQD